MLHCWTRRNGAQALGVLVVVALGVASCLDGPARDGERKPASDVLDAGDVTSVDDAGAIDAGTTPTPTDGGTPQPPADGGAVDPGFTDAGNEDVDAGESTPNPADAGQEDTGPCERSSCTTAADCCVTSSHCVAVGGAGAGRCASICGRPGDGCDSDSDCCDASQCTDGTCRSTTSCLGTPCGDGAPCCEAGPFCRSLGFWFDTPAESMSCQASCASASHSCAATSDCCGGLSCVDRICG